MNLLVTGGAGYIGSIVAARLVAEGFHVTLLDDLSTGHAEAAHGMEFFEGDYGDPAMIDWVFSRLRPEIVVHFAAFSRVEESEQKKRAYYSNNVEKLGVFLLALRRNSVEKIIHASSAAVYGAPPVATVSEDSPPAPVNIYGETKLAGERLVHYAASSYGIQSVVLRLFNVCGATPDGRFGEHHVPETHAVPNLVAAALGLRAAFEMTGGDHPTPDGSAIRDYVSVNDVAEAVLCATKFLENGHSGVFNIGSGRGVSVRELIRTVEEGARRTIPVNFHPMRTGDPAHLVARVENAQKNLGWRPRTKLEESVISTIKWMEADHRRYNR